MNSFPQTEAVRLSVLLMLLMLSYLFSWDVEHFPMAVFDQDKSPLSRQYVAALTQGGTLELRYDISANNEVDRLLLSDRVRGVLLIPPGTMARLNEGQISYLHLLLDPHLDRLSLP